MIDPLVQYLDIESEQWWNFRSRGPLAYKARKNLLVLHEGRKPIAAALGDGPQLPLPDPFEDARVLAKQLYAQYWPVDAVWVYDQPSLDKYTAACTTWTGELDMYSYRAHQLAQATKLLSRDFAVYPVSPVRIGYLTLDEAQQFLSEELPAKALLVLAAFEDQLFFSLVVEVRERLVKTVTTSDHYARQIAAAGHGPDNGLLPFNKAATATLEKLAQDEFGPLTISLHLRRNAYNDLFIDRDRIKVLKAAELRGDAWGSSALPNRYDAWQKMAGLISYLIVES